MFRQANVRLQPALLDRLEDNAPEKQEGQPVALNVTQLKQAVLRDLGWLLNTISLEAQQSLQSYPHVQSSTLNYGVAALAGKRVSDVEWDEIEQAVRTAILQFEPRILPQGLIVRCLSAATDLAHHNVIALFIKGQLWANPYPRELLIRTEIDLETSQIRVEEMDRLPEFELVHHESAFSK